MAVIAPLLWDGAKRLEWDISYDSVTVIESSTPSESESAKLVRLVIKPVLVVSSRDFCMLQLRTDGNGFIGAVAFSVDDPRVPISNDCVRGEVLSGSSWVLTPTSDGKASILTYTILTNISGWVPSLIINNAVGSTLAKYFIALSAKVTGIP